MKEQHCSASINEDNVELACTIHSGIDNFRQRLKDWPGAVQGAVREFISDNVTQEQMQAKDSIWDKFVAFLNSGKLFACIGA